MWDIKQQAKESLLLSGYLSLRGGGVFLFSSIKAVSLLGCGPHGWL